MRICEPRTVNTFYEYLYTVSVLARRWYICTQRYASTTPKTPTADSTQLLHAMQKTDPPLRNLYNHTFPSLKRIASGDSRDISTMIDFKLVDALVRLLGGNTWFASSSSLEPVSSSA